MAYTTSPSPSSSSLKDYIDNRIQEVYEHLLQEKQKRIAYLFQTFVSKEDEHTRDVASLKRDNVLKEEIESLRETLRKEHGQEGADIATRHFVISTIGQHINILHHELIETLDDRFADIEKQVNGLAKHIDAKGLTHEEHNQLRDDIKQTNIRLDGLEEIAQHLVSLEDRCLLSSSSEDKTFDAKGHRIQSVSFPQHEHDVINKSYLEHVLNEASKEANENDLSKHIHISKRGHLSFGNKILRSVAKPRDKTDVVNKSYFDESFQGFEHTFRNLLHSELRKLKQQSITRSLQEEEAFNCQNSKLINVSNPQNDQDAVTLHYLKQHFPVTYVE